MVLLDCGRSHIFISQELINRCELPKEATLPCAVELGDGHKVRCQGKCQELILEVQGQQIQQDFFVFLLSGVDIVLGFEWLASIAEVRADFGNPGLTIGLTIGKGRRSMS